jgi:hypothetical protein
MPAFTRPEPEIVAMIISETPDRIVIATELSKAVLARHRRLIENLLTIATREQLPPVEDDE